MSYTFEFFEFANAIFDAQRVAMLQGRAYITAHASRSMLAEPHEGSFLHELTSKLKYAWINGQMVEVVDRDDKAHWGRVVVHSPGGFAEGE